MELECYDNFDNSEPIYIWVGVVPTEFTSEVAHCSTRYNPGENFYGCQMSLRRGKGFDINVENGVGRAWSYSCPTTIELILDCETRILYLKFYDGKQLDIKLKRWDAWRLFVKLMSSGGWSDGLITVRVGIV
jgi:hypothetical protein